MPAALSLDSAVGMASGPSSASRVCNSVGRSRVLPQGKASFSVSGSLDTLNAGAGALHEVPHSVASPESSPSDGLPFVASKAGSSLRPRSTPPLTRRTGTSPGRLRACFSSVSDSGSLLPVADDEATGSEATTAVGSSAPSPVSRQEVRGRVSAVTTSLETLASAIACREKERGETSLAAAVAPDATEAAEPDRVAPQSFSESESERDREGDPYRGVGALLLPIPTRRSAFEERETDRNCGSASDSGVEFLVRLRRHSRRGADRDDESGLHSQLAKRVSFGSPLSVEVHQYSYADGCRSSGGSAMSSQDSSHSSLSSLSPSPPSSQSLLSHTVTAHEAPSHAEGFRRGQVHLTSLSYGLDLYSSSPPWVPDRGSLEGVSRPDADASSMRVGDLSDSDSTNGCMTRRHTDVSSGFSLPVSFRFFGAGSTAADSIQKPPLSPSYTQSPVEQRDSSSGLSGCPQSPEHRLLGEPLSSVSRASSPPSLPRWRLPPALSPLGRPSRCPLSPRSSSNHQASPRKKAAPTSPPCERESPGGPQGCREGALLSLPPQAKTDARKPKTSPLEACLDARKKKKQEFRPVTLSPVATMRTREREKSPVVDGSQEVADSSRPNAASLFRDVSCERNETNVESSLVFLDAVSSSYESLPSRLPAFPPTSQESPCSSDVASLVASSRQEPREKHERKAAEADVISSLVQTSPSCSLCVSDPLASVG
ncbi:hypothetical protein TGPRC2_238020 [Toxoplasma gondii TgCatPRC2]|uniref:Uncharacterized protein n=1 Tax=Toxoplasma gondii TgCatPRC2 TaxID=1130821 RepID=A0A151H074_TOXGO|nr:hypothetical protein TGPRC2_238020 [Toxoplasma gondii TgCatPRC2]